VNAALVTGLSLGFLVGAQVGPIWLLCARSSLRHGAPSGLAIGLGAALARAEGYVVFDRLLDRFSVIEPGWGDSRPTYRETIVLHGLESLPVRVR